jgi:hypothetical protein
MVVQRGVVCVYDVTMLLLCQCLTPNPLNLGDIGEHVIASSTFRHLRNVTTNSEQRHGNELYGKNPRKCSYQAY